MKNIIIAVVAIVVIALGVIFLKDKPAPVNPGSDVTEPSSETTTSPTGTVSGAEGSTVVTPGPGTYKNDELGFSLTYPKNLGTFKLAIVTSGHGESIEGGLCDQGSGFCMTAAGVTPDTFMQIGANGLFKYPTAADIAELEKGGYKTETKTNANGESYLLIHGKKEIDTHYIGENQAVAVFKLVTPPNFNVITFMLNTGDMKTFLKIMDSVKIY